MVEGFLLFKKIINVLFGFFNVVVYMYNFLELVFIDFMDKR